MTRILLGFCVIYMFSGRIWSQEYAFREWSLKKGLPQSQVKAINQDREGFLWVGTLGGLAKFDGKNFEVFTVENGLLSNRITFIEFIDEKLYVGHENGISVRKNAKQFEALSLRDFPENLRFSHVIQFKKKILVSTNGMGLYEIQGNTLKPISPKNIDSDELEEFQRIRKMAVVQGKLFIGTRGGLYFSQDLNTFKLIPQTAEWSVSDLEAFDNQLAVANYNDATYLLKNTTKADFDLQVLSPEFSTEVLLETIKNPSITNLWTLDENNLIRKISLNFKKLNASINTSDLVLNQNQALTKEIITTIFVDANGVLWIGTEGKGMYQFLGDAFVKYDLGSPVLSILQDGQNLWFGTMNGGLIQKNAFGHTASIPKELEKATVWATLKDKNGQLWFGTNIGIFIYNQRNWLIWTKENQKNLPSNRISALHEDTEGTIWIGTKQGLARAVQGVILPVDFTKKASPQIIRDIVSVKSDLYIATKTNLFLYAVNTGELSEINPKSQNSSFSCLLVDKYQNVWIGTEEGLYVLKDGEFNLIEFARSSSERFINFLVRQNDQVIAGTNNGLFLFSDFDASLQNFRVRHFDEDYGLSGTETNIKSAFVEKNNVSKLWFGTSDGLFLFNMNRLNQALDNYKPKLYLSEFQVNFAPYELKNSKENFELKSNQNRLRFIFQVLDLYQMDKVKLQYRMGSSEDWIEVGQSSEIVFNQLAAGNYELQVRAQGGNGNYSDIMRFHFEILKPFYATWWFILMLILGAILIIVTIARYRINQIKSLQAQEKLALNNRLNALEQQSLNASMNRHFIFNALNSIQYFINTQDKLSANKYLSKFAQLIRKNLDSSASGESKVSLAEELQRLELYLTLESMRFDGRFHYHFDIDEDIDQEELTLPAMLFQPFIENAIIHGILPKDDLVGQITFSAKRIEDRIEFTITDNGQGYSTSLSQKKDDGDHYSHGTNITKSRIEVIRKISGDVIELIGPEDLIDENNAIIGTKVVIRLKEML